MDHLLVQFAGPLAGPADRIVHAPGKLLRPGLTFAAASLAAPPGDAAVSAAAGVGAWRRAPWWCQRSPSCAQRQAWENHHRFSTMTTVDDALSVT